MSRLFRNRVRLRGAAVSAAALALAGCSSAQVPELSEVKLLPEMRSFLPSNSNTYAGAIAMRTLKPVGPADVVDGQGLCAGVSTAAEPGAVTSEAAAAAQPALPQPVALEMTECEVVRALGTPARAEVGSGEGGERSVSLTYLGTDRAGVYQFKGGRLATMERGAEAPPAPKPDKKTNKKAAPAKKPAKPAA